MSEKLKELEKNFKAAADMVGYCPLDDPETDGVRAVEQPALIRVKLQPRKYNYDKEINESELDRFRKSLIEKWSSGELKFTQMVRLWNTIN